jgi:signal peptidase I
VDVPVVAAPNKASAPKKSFLSSLAELAVLIVIAFGVAVLVKTLLVQPFYIPSTSMVPTIEVNDRVLVNKLAFRVGEPRRGDVVVFLNPYDFGNLEESVPEAVVRHILEAIGVRTAHADDFIKRIVALERDVIEIHDNELLINGEPVDEPYLNPGSVMPDRPAETVPPGHVFVMGDNRTGSQDSRIFGPIPVEDLVGRAFVTIWPIDRWGGL